MQQRQEHAVASVLVVARQPPTTRVLRLNLALAGFDVVVVHAAALALDTARQLVPSVVVVRLPLPGVEPLSFLGHLHGAVSDASFVVIGAPEALMNGSFDAVYLASPFDPTHLVAIVRDAIDARRARDKPRGPDDAPALSS